METFAKLKTLIEKKRWAMPVAGIVFSLIIAILIGATNGGNSKEETGPETADMATLIPSGFSLVNITVQNPEAVESMVAQFGIVDLYTKKRHKPFATGVRIIRMPGSPMNFGVLVPEEETSRIIRENDEPFHVSLQSSDRPLNFAPDTSPTRKIIWED